MQSSRFPGLRRITDLDRYKGVADNEQISRWYGVVCFDPATRLTLIAPIPLNILLAWARGVWLRLQRGRLTDDLRWAYRTGYQDGLVEQEHRKLYAEIEEAFKAARRNRVGRWA